MVKNPCQHNDRGKLTGKDNMRSHPNKQIILIQEENMSNDLITQDDFTKQLVELDKIQETCKKLLATKHYQSLGESGIHGIIARAKGLGIHPFEALNGMFYNVNGKIGMSTETMAALVRKRGHSITKDVKSNNECVILHGKRADTGDTWTCSFTKDDAIAAGLWNGPTWKKYPAVMLYNRCMSMLFRQLFPDLSMGAGYVEDELKEIAKVDEYRLPESQFEDVTPQKTKKVEFTAKLPDEFTCKSTHSTDKKEEEPKISGAQVRILEDLEPLLDEETKRKSRVYMLEKGASAYSELNQKEFNVILKCFNKNIEKQDKDAGENSVEVSVAEDESN